MAPLLTINEVCARLRVSRWLVYDLVRDGDLPAVRLTRRRLLFTEQAVEDLVRRHEDTRQAENGDGAGCPG